MLEARVAARSGPLREVARGPNRPAAGGTFWHLSWWGFSYYADRAGMSPLQLNERLPRPGDLIAVHDMPEFLASPGPPHRARSGARRCRGDRRRLPPPTGAGVLRRPHADGEPASRPRNTAWPGVPGRCRDRNGKDAAPGSDAACFPNDAIRSAVRCGSPGPRGRACPFRPHTAHCPLPAAIHFLYAAHTPPQPIEDSVHEQRSRVQTGP